MSVCVCIYAPISATLLASTSLPFVALSGQTMGTYYRVSFYGLRPIPIHDEIEKIFEQVNQDMSTYRQSSLISQFNQLETTGWFPVSDDFIRVAQYARKAYDHTDGAFDPTVGRIVKMWGFGPEYRADQMPPEEAIQSELAHVGYHQIEIRAEPSAIRKSNPLVYLDFSGVAKGYAVDLVAEYLESIGISSYLVEIGGDLRTGMVKPDGKPWLVAIEHPDTAAEGYLRVVNPKGHGVVSSGDYRNYFELDSRRYSHIISPVTGYPVEQDLVSVTVVAPTAAEADGYSTGLLALGKKRAMELAQKHGLAVYFVQKQNDSWPEAHTKGFQTFLIP